MAKSGQKRAMVAGPMASGPSGMEDWGAGVTRTDRRGVPVEIGARAGEARRLEPVDGDANGRRRVRRLHVLEAMCLEGRIAQHEAAAGLLLSAAWEAVQMSPVQGVVQDRVDGSRRPDARTSIMVERQDRYARMMRAVPRDAVQAVRHVCCEGRSLRDGLAANGRGMAAAVEALRMGLGVLAEHLGLCMRR